MSLIKTLLTACFLFALLSCNSRGDNLYIDDPYGVVEAEELGEVSERLIECSKSKECPEYAQALFWVAADILSKASATIIEVEGQGFGQTRDMPIEGMAQKVSLQLEALLSHGTPEYDFEDPNFKRGLGLLNKASRAGSIYASNELGVFYMEQSKVQDLDLAEMYLTKSLDQGDLFGAYNLARLARIQSVENNKKVVEYLKISSQGGRLDMKNAYMLGLWAFGDAEEKLLGLNYIENNKLTDSFMLREFEEDFGLNEPSKTILE